MKAPTAIRPQVLGVWPAGNVELRAAITEATRKPNTLAISAPASLRCGRWTPGDHNFLSYAELAAIRWQHVHYASEGEGRRIADSLRDAGYSALAFMEPLHRVTDSQARLLGTGLAQEMALELRGGIYLLPWPEWKQCDAQAIEADAAAEIAHHRRSNTQWQLCRERRALFDHFECHEATQVAP
ncbi:MAG: hypothetical protein RIK00_05495 [Algiphilus sp.]|uniref:hypothetical protein n=1 Tax=Algiphilus sp. TaxID=1872431 RepID=UPI0032EEFE21